MSQTISATSVTIHPGTRTIGSVPLAGGTFSSLRILLDSSGVAALTGVVATLTFSLSSDGGNTFTDYPQTINGGPIKNGAPYVVGFSVDPPRPNSHLKLTLQTFQAWTTSVTAVIN